MGPPPKIRLSWDRFTGNLATHQKKGGVAPGLTVWSLDSMMQKLFEGLWAALHTRDGILGSIGVLISLVVENPEHHLI
jgi:hypothetical protein